jgi:glycosidase
MKPRTYPSLYQVNTRVMLSELGRKLGRVATLDDISDAELDRFAEQGFDWVWFLSVWQTGEASRKISLATTHLRAEFQETLPDCCDEDIPGSGFAISAYRVHEALGGAEALARLRERVNSRGMRLMLDFVPNHMALDHAWLHEHPEYFISGSEKDADESPQNYTRVKSGNQHVVLAHGRDPYFPGWSDTLQLNYANADFQVAMVNELVSIAEQCDGLRCDMAMLLLPEIFERTWGKRPEAFWPKAIGAVRARNPSFCFLAEVYWELEWALQQQGFDYAYDKRLYDRLREGNAQAVREHLRAGLDYQGKLARFLENHDEPRAAAIFPANRHQAAAVVTFFAPGMRVFHQGQFEGRLKRISPHLARAPVEVVNEELRAFYSRVLEVLKRPSFGNGEWRLVDCAAAWEGNQSHESFIVYAWQDATERYLVAVNYSEYAAQCYVPVPFPELAGRRWTLKDLMGDAVYEREGNELIGGGLYLEVRAWRFYVFEISPT